MKTLPAIVLLFMSLTAVAQGVPKGDCATPEPRHDLSGCDFSGRDLSGRDFSGAVLENARFNLKTSVTPPRLHDLVAARGGAVARWSRGCA